MSDSYRLILAAAQAIVAEHARLEAAPPSAMLQALAAEHARREAAASQTRVDPTAMLQALAGANSQQFLDWLMAFNDTAHPASGFQAPAEPDFDPNDPSLLMNILLDAPGVDSAEVVAEADPEADPEIDPHEAYAFDCPAIVPELPLDHPAQAAYNRAWHDLSALYSDFHNGGDRPAIAKATAEVWKAFLALKQYSEDPQYGVIRDHVRASVKPACADLIAQCAEGGGE